MATRDLIGSRGARETADLGPGWVGFDFAAAFGEPVKVVNDAAMQALGSYEGGRMLFLGLGTGLGTTLVTGRSVFPLELRAPALYAASEHSTRVWGGRGCPGRARCCARSAER